MPADPIWQQVGEGWALENLDFFGVQIRGYDPELLRIHTSDTLKKFSKEFGGSLYSRPLQIRYTQLWREPSWKIKS